MSDTVSHGFPPFRGEYIAIPHDHNSCNGYHSCSSSRAGSASTTPPALNTYRRTMETCIEKVNPGLVEFLPSPQAGVHPFEDPKIVISSVETRHSLEVAATFLKNGHCVAFPTETVYGLGADATSTEAVKSIYVAKSRPADNPLIVHISSLRQLRKLLPRPPMSTLPESNLEHQPPPAIETIPEVYKPLIDRFWPGPLTILLPLPIPNPLSTHVTSTQPTFAARMPRHPIALALSAISGLPLAAPSANASGMPSPTTAQHVSKDLHGKLPLIIDSGSAEVGLESTVVDGLHYPPVVLRPGGVSVEEIRACGGVWEKVIVATHEDDDCEGTPRAPGMKYKHYSPRAGVILYEVGANPPSGAHIMGSRKRVGILRTRTWKAGFAEEAVRNIRQTDSSHPPVEIFERDLGYHGKDIGRRLFRALRELDEKEVDVIHVEGIEEVDEGLAVMNRLGKAASVVVRKVARDERDER